MSEPHQKMSRADLFDQQLEIAREQLAILRRNTGTTPKQQAMLRKAVQDLSKALKKVNGSVAELRSRGVKSGSAGASLAAEREHYQSLFEFAPDAYVVTDGQGTIQEANQATANLLDRERDLVVGKPLHSFVLADDRQAFDAQLEQLQSGRTDHLREWETRLQRCGRTAVSVALTAATRCGAEGRVIEIRWLLRDMTAHHHTSAALRESEARTRAIVNTAVDGIITIDEQGRIESFNPAAARLFGYEASEVIGRNISVLMPESYGVGHDGYVSTYLRTGQRKIIGIGREVVGQRKDGATFPMELAVSEVQLGERRIFTGLLRDITDRKKAERLRATQFAVTRVLAGSATFREAMPRLLESICDGGGWDLGELWQLDRDAQLLRWYGMWHASSVDAAEFAAVSRETTLRLGVGLAGRVWASGEPARLDDSAVQRRYVRTAAIDRAGLRGAFAFPIRHANEISGVMVFFARHSRPPDDDLLQMLEALGSQIGDFVARKRTEEALRASETRFALFMQHLPGVAFMKDIEGRYLYVNEPFENLYHRKMSEWLGKTDEQVWPAAIASQFHENDRRALDSRKALQTIETVPHDDGPHSWLVSKFPIVDRSGTPVMIGGVGVDITERERAAAEVRELQRVGQQRERLADIGAITAQIVHDLGNPLAGVSMQAQLILRRAQRDAAQPLSMVLKPVERIVAEVHRLDTLIREFMDFSREQRLDLRCIELHRFLGAVVELWGPVAAARGIALALDVIDPAPALTADEEKLHRVFENLVKNAVEAIGTGPGRIRISVTVPEPEKVCISVEDTGPGIEDTVQVFRLFETTKPNGSGLGLPIVRQIVLAHGGGIAFARVKPHGTVFHVELPTRGPLR